MSDLEKLKDENLRLKSALRAIATSKLDSYTQDYAELAFDLRTIAQRVLQECETCVS
jgi:hypothetical protein